MAPNLRPAARAVVVDPAGAVLLVRFDFPGGSMWATPGGGVEPGELRAEAVRRELREEVTTAPLRIGPPVWIRRHFVSSGGWDGQEENFFHVPVATRDLRRRC